MSSNENGKPGEVAIDMDFIMNDNKAIIELKQDQKLTFENSSRNSLITNGDHQQQSPSIQRELLRKVVRVNEVNDPMEKQQNLGLSEVFER